MAKPPVEKAKKDVRFWLMKTEPDVFSFDDMIKSPKRTTSWEGVRNYQARNSMRDEFQLGDTVFVYHSSCEEPGIVGLGEVVRAAHPDNTALNPKSPYFDEKSAKDGASRWLMVDVKAMARLAVPLTLARLRETPELAGLLVLKRGMRLSIQPVEPADAKLLLKLGKPQAL